MGRTHSGVAERGDPSTYHCGNSFGDSVLRHAQMRPTAGFVTLLFTDIEGGVRLWEDDRDAAMASARTDRIVREQVEASGGYVF